MSQAELPPDYWSTASDYRFRNGRAEVVKGFVEAAVPDSELGQRNNLAYHLVYTVANEDLVDNGGVSDDIFITVGYEAIYGTSPTTGQWVQLDEGDWLVDFGDNNGIKSNLISSAVLNGIPFLAASGESVGTPYYWLRDSATGFQPYTDGTDWPQGLMWTVPLSQPNTTCSASVCVDLTSLTRIPYSGHLLLSQVEYQKHS